jgi:glycosyltransferase involved in cell wall biosynthesis
MRVAFPYPSYWPYTRRGGERLVHDLATYLAGRGHEVHVITSTPGRMRRALDGRVQVTYLRQLSHPLLYEYAPVARQLSYALQVSRVLVDLKADVAHFLSYSNIPWVPLLRRALDLPYIFQAIVLKDRFPRTRWAPLFNQALVRADRVAALTPGGARVIEREFGVRCGVLPPPVDTTFFRPVAPRASQPEVLFTADLADGWKGGTLLLRAWNHVHRRRPDARLVLAGPMGMAGWTGRLYPSTMLGRFDLVRDPAARRAIEVRGTGQVDALPGWYSRAWVTVLPSIQEAFGLVLTESLACGTPVVASSCAGPGEIVTDPDVGATVHLEDHADLLSATRAEELADAILYAIELAAAPHSRDRCRDWAGRWALESVGPSYEAALSELAA